MEIWSISGSAYSIHYISLFRIIQTNCFYLKKINPQKWKRLVYDHILWAPQFKTLNISLSPQSSMLQNDALNANETKKIFTSRNWYVN